MNNGLPHKKRVITLDGKKIIFRQRNPIVLINILSLFALSLLTVGIIIYDKEWIFFSVAILPILLTIYIQANNLSGGQYNRATSLCAKIDYIRFNKYKMTMTIKNIGFANIMQATLSDLFINDTIPIIKPVMINFLPIRESVDVSIDLPCQLDNIKKLSYVISIGYENVYVVLVYKQKMYFKNGKCKVKSNTSKLLRRIYYKWKI